MNSESIALYYKEGRSDKVYQVQLLEDKMRNGWVVNFQYGRRGRSLVKGTKTEHVLPSYRAKRLYDSLVSSKRAKGYKTSLDMDFVGYTEPLRGLQSTKFKPQLLNAVTQDEALALFDKYNLFLQIKHDGERRGVIYSPNEIIGANRKGFKTPLAKNIQEQLERWHRSSRTEGILDTEDMQDYLVIFDALTDEPTTFRERSYELERMREEMHRLCLTDLIVDQPYEPLTKADMLMFIMDAQNNGEEGVVIRDGNGLYTPGKPNSGGPVWKLKFYEDATCMVESIHSTKRSIGLCMFKEGTQQTERVSLGNCTIPPNHAIPSAGQLVEIRYLYAYRNGSLYQPQYKGIRTDIDPAAAVTSQLKYKA